MRKDTPAGEEATIYLLVPLEPCDNPVSVAEKAELYTTGSDNGLTFCVSTDPGKEGTFDVKSTWDKGDGITGLLLAILDQSTGA